MSVFLNTLVGGEIGYRWIETREVRERGIRKDENNEREREREGGSERERLMERAREGVGEWETLTLIRQEENEMRQHLAC